MYVCLCMGLTEDDIKGYIKKGYNTPSELMRHTFAGLGCASCTEDLEKLIMEENACSYTPRELPILVIKAF